MCCVRFLYFYDDDAHTHAPSSSTIFIIRRHKFIIFIYRSTDLQSISIYVSLECPTIIVYIVRSLTFVRRAKRERERDFEEKKRNQYITQYQYASRVCILYIIQVSNIYKKKRRTVNTNAGIDDETQKQFFTCRGSKVVHGVR